MLKDDTVGAGSVSLDRSLSIIAEALAPHLPYRWVRHPLYLAEALTHWPFPAQFAFQLRRMHNKERVLTETLLRIGRLHRAAGPWHLLNPARPSLRKSS